jgi:hypothetical protein
MHAVAKGDFQKPLLRFDQMGISDLKSIRNTPVTATPQPPQPITLLIFAGAKHKIVF